MKQTFALASMLGETAARDEEKYDDLIHAIDLMVEAADTYNADSFSGHDEKRRQVKALYQEIENVARLAGLRKGRR